MCLAMPVQITELVGEDMARVTLDGVSRLVSVALIDDLAVGDYVILHVGYALEKLDPEEAEATLAAIAEAALTEGELAAQPAPEPEARA